MQMNTTQRLKLAKKAIQENDYVKTLDITEEIIKEDDNNYMAYIFRGKAYQMLNEIEKSLIELNRATKIEPECILGWRGYLSVLKEKKDLIEFFRVLSVCLDLDNTEPVEKYIEMVKQYLKQHEIEKKGKEEIEFLRILGMKTGLWEQLNYSFGKRSEIFEKLIDLTKKKTEIEVKNLTDKRRLKFGSVLKPSEKDELNLIVWECYEDSELLKIYEIFLSESDNDAKREEIMIDKFSLQYRLIECCPLNQRQDFFLKVKNSADDMVFLRNKSQLAWNMHFEWLDIKDFRDLNIDDVIFYCRTFPMESLAIIFRLYLVSEISVLDLKIVNDKLEDWKADSEEMENTGSSTNIVENYFSVLDLSSQNNLSLMVQTLDSCQNLILSNRIVCTYYLYFNDYISATKHCRKLISLLSNFEKTTSTTMPNTKEDILCMQATVDTFCEGKQNYSRAFALYDEVLSLNKFNIVSKIGKALIFLEKNEIESAYNLLVKVNDEYPDNSDCLLQYGICLLKMSDFLKCREVLFKLLDKTYNNSKNNCELRAKIFWLIAKSYLNKIDVDDEDLNYAFSYLIKSLKESQNFAPSYTELGLLTQNYLNDEQKAEKCFYKAFEIDVTEIISAYYLVVNFTNRNEWGLSEIICKRIINSERALAKLASSSTDFPDFNWPYKVLAFASLSKNNDLESIDWFQKYLGPSNNDVNSWIGLIEASYNSGKLDTSIKLCKHALSFANDSWVIKYMLGLFICQTKNYNDGIAILQSALDLNPNEELIYIMLCQSYCQQSYYLLECDFYEKAFESVSKCLNYIVTWNKINLNLSSIWRILVDCIKLYLMFKKKLKCFPLKTLGNLFGLVDTLLFIESNFISEDDFDNQFVSYSGCLDLFETGNYLESLLNLVILCSRINLFHTSNIKNKFLYSTLFYNLGVSYLDGYHHLMNEDFKKLSIKYLKKAIVLDNTILNYWNAMGIIYILDNAMISQHFFIKALSLEDRNADIWNNLGILYLYNGNNKLAKQAFLMGRSILSQNSNSWLGYALSTSSNNSETETKNLLTHAYMISNQKNPVSQLLYSYDVLNRYIGNNSKNTSIDISQEFSIANFAMKKYLCFHPNCETALQISLDLNERCKIYDNALESGLVLLELLKTKDYDPKTSIRILKLQAQLSRIHLCMGEFENVIKNVTSSLQTIKEFDKEDSSFVKIIMSFHLTIGLALYFKNQFEESIHHFKSTLLIKESSSILVSTIAQVLYSNNTKRSKEAAIQQLFNYIETYGSSSDVVIVLSAISILENITENFIPLKEELQNLSYSEIVHNTDGLIPVLLSVLIKKIKKLHSYDPKIWQRYIYLSPSNYIYWSKIHNKTALLICSLKNTKINSYNLSKLYSNSNNLREIQRSLILSPSNSKALQKLSLFT